MPLRKGFSPGPIARTSVGDRKSTRLNSSHTVIYILSLHDALPIYQRSVGILKFEPRIAGQCHAAEEGLQSGTNRAHERGRSEEHTSELQSHSDLHSFPTRRSSDLSTFRRNFEVRAADRRPVSCR